MHEISLRPLTYFSVQQAYLSNCIYFLGFALGYLYCNVHERLFHHFCFLFRFINVCVILYVLSIYVIGIFFFIWMGFYLWYYLCVIGNIIIICSIISLCSYFNMDWLMDIFCYGSFIFTVVNPSISVNISILTVCRLSFYLFHFFHTQLACYFSNYW